MTSDALDAVVDAVVDDEAEAPASSATCRTSAERSSAGAARTGASAEVEQRQGVYMLLDVETVPRPSGAARVATRADRDLLVGWLHAFAQEATGQAPGEPGLLERILDARLAAEDPAHAGYWVWEDEALP